MKRLASIFILAILLLCMSASVGCKDIDWKDAAKRIVIEWVKDQAILAIDQFKDNKGQAVDWITARINEVDALAPYIKLVNIEGVIGAAYDFILQEIYNAAKRAGMDVDGEYPGYYCWYVSGADFPGVDAELLKLME